MASPQDPLEVAKALLETAVRDILNTRYSELASSTIIVFDYLVTLDEEIEYIWNAGWSTAKCLFLFNRYYGLATVIINNYGLFSSNLTDSRPYSQFFTLAGTAFFQWQGWTGLIACVISEIILQVRLYALYFLDKRILAVMLIGFVSAIASSAAIMGTVLANTKATSHLIPSLPFCIPTQVASHFYAFWIPILAFETLLCALAVARVLRGLRGRGSGGPVFNAGRHLVRVLIRDSVFYFFVMFATYFTSALIWIIGPESKIEIPIGFTVAMSCVMGNRLILNIRRTSRKLGTSRGLSVSQDISRSGLVASTSMHDMNKSKSSPGTMQSRVEEGLDEGHTEDERQLEYGHEVEYGYRDNVRYARPSEPLTEYEMAELRTMRARGVAV